MRSPLYFILNVFLWFTISHSFPGDNVLDVPSLSSSSAQVRQASKLKEPLCREFHLTYAEIRKITLWYVQKLKPSEKQYEKCKLCWTCTWSGCKKKRSQALVNVVNQCYNTHKTLKVDIFACVMAVYMIGRRDEINFGCTLYFKDSTIGNCYAEEYITLNGMKGKNNSFVFFREKGIFNEKNFQCRAKKRANLPNLKNQHACRTKFKVSIAKVNRVATCAYPAFMDASNALSICLGGAGGDFFRINQCNINYNFAASMAFINCINPYGVPAVAIASLSAGINALGCPPFRRDSFVGKCKASDYMQLYYLKQVTTTKKGFLKVLLPGACDYKK